MHNRSRYSLHPLLCKRIPILLPSCLHSGAKGTSRYQANPLSRGTRRARPTRSCKNANVELELEETSCAPCECMHTFHIVQVSFYPIRRRGQLDAKMCIHNVPRGLDSTLEIHSIAIHANSSLDLSNKRKKCLKEFWCFQKVRGGVSLASMRCEGSNVV